MSERYTYQQIKEQIEIDAEKCQGKPTNKSGHKKNKKKSVIDKLQFMLPQMQNGLKMYAEMKPMATREERLDYLRPLLRQNLYRFPWWFCYLSLEDMAKCINELVSALEAVKDDTMLPKKANELINHWDRYGMEVWQNKLKNANDGLYHSAWEFID